MRFTATCVMCGRFSVQNVGLQRVFKMIHSHVPETPSTSFISPPQSVSRLFSTAHHVSFITFLKVNITQTGLGVFFVKNVIDFALVSINQMTLLTNMLLQVSVVQQSSKFARLDALWNTAL